MSHHAWPLLIVFVGGGLGSMLRYAVTQISAAAFGPAFPWGTLIVNVTGSLIMGLLAGGLAFREENRLLRLFLATGILGGFTTFSAFSLDAALLWERGHTGLAAFYVLGSLATAVTGVFAGIAIMRALLQ